MLTGYRADECRFGFVEAFLNNTITVEHSPIQNQTSIIILRTKAKTQIGAKSKKILVSAKFNY